MKVILPSIVALFSLGCSGGTAESDHQYAPPPPHPPPRPDPSACAPPPPCSGTLLSSFDHSSRCHSYQCVTDCSAHYHFAGRACSEQGKVCSGPNQAAYYVWTDCTCTNNGWECQNQPLGKSTRAVDAIEIDGARVEVLAPVYKQGSYVAKPFLAAVGDRGPVHYHLAKDVQELFKGQTATLKIHNGGKRTEQTVTHVVSSMRFRETLVTIPGCHWREDRHVIMVWGVLANSQPQGPNTRVVFIDDAGQPCDQPKSD